MTRTCGFLVFTLLLVSCSRASENQGRVAQLEAAEERDPSATSVALPRVGIYDDSIFPAIELPVLERAEGSRMPPRPSLRQIHDAIRRENRMHAPDRNRIASLQRYFNTVALARPSSSYPILPTRLHQALEAVAEQRGLLAIVPMKLSHLSEAASSVNVTADIRNWLETH